MKFSSQGKQLNIETFRSSLAGLNKTNRWVKLGDSLPWGEIERLYNKRLHNGKRGAGNKPARMIIGALIVKHKMNLSDEETILAIQENPYIQYFLGISEFTDKPVFDASLFVTIRKRVGIEDFNDMSVSLLTMQLEKARAAEQSEQEKGEKPGKGSNVCETSKEKGYVDSKGEKHKGALKIDATCSDAEVRYPTDIDLLHDGCRVMNRYIEKLSRRYQLERPKTEYKSERKAYLEVIRRKKRSRKLIERSESKLLSYLQHDIRNFAGLIAENGTEIFYRMKKNEQRTAGAIIRMYHQQEEMYRTGAHRCKDRIVSIFQPHIHPIVRGKSKAPTEFGAKMGASIVKGYTFIDHYSWEAYNEGGDMSKQIELYRKRFGCLPEKVYADKIYMNRENRRILKEKEIEAMGRPLGRPSKESQTAENRLKMAKSVGERNEIEATFGTGKRVYRANNIRAKLPETANSWTGMCYFVKNVMKFLRELLHALFLVVEILANPERLWKNLCSTLAFAYC